MVCLVKKKTTCQSVRPFWVHCFIMRFTKVSHEIYIDKWNSKVSHEIYIDKWNSHCTISSHDFIDQPNTIFVACLVACISQARLMGYKFLSFCYLDKDLNMSYITGYKRLHQPGSWETSFIFVSRGPISLDARWLLANDMISIAWFAWAQADSFKLYGRFIWLLVFVHPGLVDIPI
jgi:hypothetical protein